MYSDKYKDVVRSIQYNPNKLYRPLIRIANFSDIPVAKINKETYVIDIFGCLKKIDISSIIISKEHCMISSTNGELIWINTYQNFENLFLKLERFIDKKTKLSPYLKNIILDSVLYNAENIRSLISICKGDSNELW